MTEAALAAEKDSEMPNKVDPPQNRTAIVVTAALAFAAGILWTLLWNQRGAFVDNAVGAVAGGVALVVQALVQIHSGLESLRTHPAELTVKGLRSTGGWQQTELPKLNASDGHSLSEHYKTHGCPAPGYTMVLVHRDPMVAFFKDFLSPLEVEHMLAVGLPRFARSTVVSDDGNSVSDYRTSYSAYLTNMEEDMVVQCILERAASVQGRVPIDRIEPPQLVRYNKLQQYKGHHDWFHNTTDGGRQELGRGGQRTTSFFVYLFSNVTGGGETGFTRLFKPKEELERLCDIVVCDDAAYADPSPGVPSGSNDHPEVSRGLRFKPILGGAVFWYNVGLDNTGDLRTLHAGLQVHGGLKVAMNIWTRFGKFI